MTDNQLTIAEGNDLQDYLAQSGAGHMALCPVCGAPVLLWDAMLKWTVRTRYRCGSTFVWGHHQSFWSWLKPTVVQIRLDCLERYKKDPIPLTTPARWKHHLKRALNHLWFD